MSNLRRWVNSPLFIHARQQMAVKTSFLATDEQLVCFLSVVGNRLGLQELSITLIERSFVEATNEELALLS
jgi:hypothetical protein